MDWTGGGRSWVRHSCGRGEVVSRAGIRVEQGWVWFEKRLSVVEQGVV